MEQLSDSQQKDTVNPKLEGQRREKILPEPKGLGSFRRRNRDGFFSVRVVAIEKTQALQQALPETGKCYLPVPRENHSWPDCHLRGSAPWWHRAEEGWNGSEGKQA